MPLNIVFRADASPAIGSGHIMRCLTLAMHLKSIGMQCRFVCRDFKGNLGRRIEDAGFVVTYLPLVAGFPSDDWLGASPHEDASQTLNAPGDFSSGWLVVDHYGIDEAWERKFKNEKPKTRIFVIDDLANRKHECDCLLDLSPGRKEADYIDRVGSQTQLCLGLDFALLRPEFPLKRGKLKQAGDTISSPPHILVTFGGGDISAHLAESGKALKELSRVLDFTATVIGAETAAKQHFPPHIGHLGHSGQMAEEIAKADLMICAAGGTNWERYCLGVPGVVIKIADNQAFNAAAIAASGGGLLVESKADQIFNAAQILLTHRADYKAMANRCWELCDGKGVKRVGHALARPFVKLVECTADDARFVYDARYGGGAQRFYKNPVRPGFDDHVKWFEKALKSDAYKLYCVEIGTTRIAHVRLDPNPDDPSRVEVGIALHQSARGVGWGNPALNAACEMCFELGFEAVDAEVHKENTASMKLFEGCGFSFVSKKDETLVHLALEV